MTIGRRSIVLLAATHWLVLLGCDAAGGDTGSEDERVLAPPGAAVDVTLNPYIGRLVTVEVMVQSDTARLILDTGGGNTLISPELAERIGCSPTGRSVGFRMSGERVDFAFCNSVTLHIEGVPFEHPRIAVWDIEAVLPEDAPRVDGVLSLQSFATRPITLRLAERLLTLETPASLATRVGELRPVVSRFASGQDGDALTVFVKGTAPDTAWYLLDSGNLDLVQASPQLAESAPQEAETREDTLVLEGLVGQPASFRARDIIFAKAQ